jgi:4-hydroxy-tetrahydrodipicolinate reductase
VAQWGTGDAGMRCLRAIIAHPRFDLAAVRVYSDAKAGRDAGDLCGAAPTGIAATQDLETVIAARPDCVVYMAAYSEIDALCRLLETGSNIVTARTEFNCRDFIEPETRRKLEAACRQGNTSLYCTGATPGWFTENLPFALSLLERRIDCITLTDFADMSCFATPQMLFEVLPFGADPARFASIGDGATPKISPGSLSMTAAALGLGVEEFVTSNDVALTRNRVEIAAGTLEKGTVGAFSRSISGLRGGKTVIRRNSILYVTRDLDPEWDLRDSGQHMRIDGDVPLEIMFTVPRPADDHATEASGLTANPVVNSVPYVCAANAGIVHTDELPAMIVRFDE